MNIESKKGDKVIFTGKGGYDSDNEYARKWLRIGNIYTVDYTIIGGFDTRVILVEEPDKKFNSVMFDDAKLAEEHHSDLIDSLEIQQPNQEDYKGDGSTQDYINDTLEYIDRLKRNHEIELEMYAIAMDEDKITIDNAKDQIKKIIKWHIDIPFENYGDKPIELAKCDSCDGTGEKFDYEERKCYKCNGTGTIDKRKLWKI
jgi:hypothetical protein